MRVFSQIFLSLIFCVMLAFWACDTPSGPTDPRNYKWTVDTLEYPGSLQTNMRAIWGSTSKDVYVVGHNEGSAQATMYRFNGISWNTTKFHVVAGGLVSGALSLTDVLGFDQNNIWVVGAHYDYNPTPPPPLADSSFIMHFDGQQWREINLNTRGGNLFTLAGTGPNNLWAAGYYGSLFHFDGQTWERDSVPLDLPKNLFFTFSALAVLPSGNVFLTGYTSQSQPAKTTHYLATNQSGSWAVVDSFATQLGLVENKWGYADFWVSPSGTLYSCGANIHQWRGNAWVKIFDHTSFLSGISGTSDENIFVVGHFGTVLHWNGKDWYQYRQFEDPGLLLEDVWTDGREVMIVGYTIAGFPQKTVVLRGK